MFCEDQSFSSSVLFHPLSQELGFAFIHFLPVNDLLLGLRHGNSVRVL